MAEKQPSRRLQELALAVFRFQLEGRLEMQKKVDSAFSGPSK